MVDFESASVLDLFSGTGSLGYEFASRGCEDIVSVEMNPVNAGFIKGFVRKLGIRGMHVVHQNVFDFLKICHKKFDIVTADPPYDLEGLESIPEKILFEGSNIIKEGGYFILEHPSTFSFEDKPYFLKEKKYGKVHFSIFFFGK
jgi:16S rRNA G966 N2-methylase RsmD